ncbi:hypothetical protein G7K_1583-t1 [Saitoella complicata NRRL Y-17804]|uniref:Uncharacterized protein n=1 Tax=Saitoella complicata (strain BCRC 22490 / CBS 7301 / JCM 7358 / NBRC 10748 / NRRL Y-17804) TaxID=698492 RepID=A0A0E9NDB0_SAICN|nr:hypothetical protein G7K_1583-t1 [Saitoella complicata NRRL Y-17804]
MQVRTVLYGTGISCAVLITSSDTSILLDIHMHISSPLFVLLLSLQHHHTSQTSQQSVLHPRIIVQPKSL